MRVVVFKRMKTLVLNPVFRWVCFAVFCWVSFAVFCWVSFAVFRWVCFADYKKLTGLLVISETYPHESA